MAPEAIQEYRISTNNFSAEYGRTSGFLANAITRTGGEQFHGVAYFYLKNEALNANAFQQNLIGAPRTHRQSRISLDSSWAGPSEESAVFFERL